MFTTYRISSRSYALRAAITLVVAAAPGAAQDAKPKEKPKPEFTVTVYHGVKPIVTAIGGTEVRGVDNKYERVLLPGTRVCFDVLNPHPAYYKYSLDTVSFAAPSSLPDLSSLTASLASLYAGRSGKADPHVEMLVESFAAHSAMRGPDTYEFPATYVGQVQLLANDVKDAQDVTADSKRAEALDAVRDGSLAGTNFKLAIDALGKLPKAAGRFNDADLAATLKKFAADARSHLPPDDAGRPEDLYLLNALDASAQALLHTRDELRAAYTVGALRTRYCEELGKSPKQFSLHVASANGKPDGDRWVTPTKDADQSDIPSLTATPMYERPAVELFTGGLGVAAESREFGIEEGKITEDSEFDTGFRSASTLAVTIHRFNEDKSGAISFALPIGLFGKGRVVSDVLAGPLISYRDDIRIGLAIGRSLAVKGLKDGLDEGSTAPEGKSIDDLRKLGWRPSYAVIFTVAGFDLAKLIPGT